MFFALFEFSVVIFQKIAHQFSPLCALSFLRALCDNHELTIINTHVTSRCTARKEKSQKKHRKKSAEGIAGNKKGSTFAPAFRKEQH